MTRFLTWATGVLQTVLLGSVLNRTANAFESVILGLRNRITFINAWCSPNKILIINRMIVSVLSRVYLFRFNRRNVQIFCRILLVHQVNAFVHITKGTFFLGGGGGLEMFFLCNLTRKTCTISTNITVKKALIRFSNSLVSNPVSKRNMPKLEILSCFRAVRHGTKLQVFVM